MMKGSVSAFLAMKGRWPYAAAREQARDSGLSAGLRLDIKPNVEWVVKFANKLLGVTIPLPEFSLSRSVPVLNAPLSNVVTVGVNNRAPVLAVNGGATVNTIQRVRPGDVLHIQAQLLEENTRVPQPTILPDLGLPLTGAVEVRGFVASEERPRLRGDVHAFTLPSSTSSLVMGDWTVPPGFCGDDNPRLDPTAILLAGAWSPLGIPVANNTLGAIGLTCGRINGRVAVCSRDQPWGVRTVKLEGDCGFTRDVTTTPNGTFSVSAEDVPDDCTELRMAVVDGNQRFESEYVPIPINTWPMELGELVTNRVRTSVSGTVVDLVDNVVTPVEYADVDWEGEAAMSLQDGSFYFSRAWKTCTVTVRATKGTLFGSSISVPGVLDDVTDVGQVLVSEDCPDGTRECGGTCLSYSECCVGTQDCCGEPGVAACPAHEPMCVSGYCNCVGEGAESSCNPIGGLCQGTSPKICIVF